jgi:methyl-accepting chemotaxis protein
MISFFKEHLLFQIMVFLSFIMILYLVCMLIINTRGQQNLINASSQEQYALYASSVIERMNEYFSTGNVSSVRGYLQRIKKGADGFDVLVFKPDQNISIASDAYMEGRSLSSVATDEGALQPAKNILSDGKDSFEYSFETIEGVQFINIFAAIKNSTGCVRCHGTDRKVLGGVRMSASLAKSYMIIKGMNNRLILFGVIGLGFVIVMAYTMFQRSINKPIKYLLESIGKLREGDFTHKVEIKGRDEISHICARMNLVNDNLRKMVSDVLNYTDALSLSSQDFLKISKEMSTTSKQTSDMAEAVTASSEGMNLNIKEIANSIERTSFNVKTVASSTEAMTATINEIAHNSDVARSITGMALAQTETASTNVDDLGKAATEIGRMTEAISKISDQTNLLALNAAIEAARAGDAGKGFAVVASEVKNLAMQTSEAAEDIEKTIAAIRSSTNVTVRQIKEISKIMKDVHKTVDAIALAVEEQSGTAREIASSVSQASNGIKDINENINQTSIISEDIAGSILDVNNSARYISNSSVNVHMSAEDLLKMTGQLKEAVGKFKI